MNKIAQTSVLVALMSKLIALLVAGMFATGAVFAGEHGDCTKQVGNMSKPACSVNVASLNLTPEQKTKIDAAMAEHMKAGCNEKSEAKYTEQVKSILTKEQFTKFEAECKDHGNTQA